MNQGTTNTILKNFLFFGLAVVPFIPLYVANNMFFPFITGKAFAFRIVVEIVLALWLVLVLRERGTNVVGTEKSVLPRINSLTILVTSFTFIVLVADLFGVNPLRSIWSNFERMEGWMTIIHLWAFFIVLSSAFGRGEELKKNWFRFLNVNLFAAIIVAVYGLFQYFGWAAIHQGSSRVDASLGNSAYMAVYMLINAFIAGYMVFSTNKFSIKRNIISTILSFLIFVSIGYIMSLLSIGGVGSNIMNIVIGIYLAGLITLLFISPYPTLALTFSFLVFQTATRGTIIGLIAGILVSCAIYAIFGRKEKGQLMNTRIFAGGFIVLVIILGILFYFNRNAAWIQKNGVLGRLANISLSDTKTQARGFIWPMALKGSFENPKTAIIGWGQENFNYIFNANYNPQMWMHEQWFDRAHNVFLDWLVASGLLGLGLYLSLYLISLIYIIKSDLTLAKKSVLVGLLVGYGIHNIFVFDNQTSYVTFFIILAFVQSFKSGKSYPWLLYSTLPNTENSLVLRDYVFVPVIIIAFAIGLYSINLRPLQANTYLIASLQACSNGQTASVKPFLQVLKLDQTMANQEAREQLFTCASNVIKSQLPAQTKSDFYDLVKKETEKQIAQSPNDARVHIIAGGFYNSIGDWNTGRPLLEKALALSPTKQTIIFDVVVNYLNSGKAKDAVVLMEKAYNSAPENDTAKIGYIVTLISAGEEKKAQELFGNTRELFTDPRVINAYISVKEYATVIALYKQILIKTPDDPQIYSALASVYLMDKQNYLSIQTLKTAEAKFPELKTQIETIIKQIEEGKAPGQ